MDQDTLAHQLSDLPLGPVRYFDSLGSTNIEAAQWARAGAADLSLVVAGEQTAGRGRHGRSWHTPPGAALAFSLILCPESLPRHIDDLSSADQSILKRLTALGALAVSDGLQAYAAAQALSIDPQIKWPNDVLACGHKLAGVLVESHWQGEQLTALIMGIGINVAPPSVPPREQLSFPATCVDQVLGKSANRWELLHDVLKALLDWRDKLTSSDFIQAWEGRLAYKGTTVRITAVSSARPPLEGEILSLTDSGALRLRTPSGDILTLHSGQVHLRPVDRSAK